METLAQVDYRQHNLEDEEIDIGSVVKYSVESGLRASSVVSFRVPADPERFTDLNRTFIRLELRVTKNDGEALGDEDEPFLDWQGIHSLFIGCDVKFNDTCVSNMSSYPFTAAVARYLGSTRVLREDLWDYLDGCWFLPVGKPNVSNEHGDFGRQAALFKNSRTVTLSGRLMSDVFCSARQFLPPGVSISIDLRRAADSFALCSKDKTGYHVELERASIFLRRVSLQPSFRKIATSSMESGVHFVFNRLETHIMSVPAKTSVWNWINCPTFPQFHSIEGVSQSVLKTVEGYSLTLICNKTQHLDNRK